MTQRNPGFGFRLAGGIFGASALVSLLAGCGSPLDLQSKAVLESADRPSLKASRAALAEGQAETALSIARGVLSVDPHNVGALTAAANADVALNNRKTADQEFREALAIMPSYVPALLGVGKMKLRDNANEAEGIFRTIVARNPGNAPAMVDLGVALDLQERHAEAQKMYTKALAINPELNSARVNMAVSVALSGDPVRAEQMLRDSTDASAMTPKLRANVALAETLAGQPDQARQTLLADMTPAEALDSVQAWAALAPPKPLTK